MKTCVQHDGYLIETAYRPQDSSPDGPRPWCAWVSDPRRTVIGYGSGRTEGDAVRRALIDAAHRRPEGGAVAGLLDAYQAATGGAA